MNIHLASTLRFASDNRTFNRRTSAGELCRSNQLFTAPLLGGDKFSYQQNSCTSTRFRFNKKTQLQISRIGSLSAEPECICLCSFYWNLVYFEKSDFTHLLPGNFPLHYIVYLYLLDTKGHLFSPVSYTHLTLPTSDLV